MANPLLELLCVALSVYTLVLFGRVILSWVQAFGRVPPALAPIADFTYRVTEPLVALVRRYVPTVGMLDLSVLVIFLVLSIVQRALGCGGLL
ncbi:MAG TPA: YggT family protein [Actinomycetota bacterium]|nr:YggT family protein [Actinomycetota bacterium]